MPKNPLAARKHPERGKHWDFFLGGENRGVNFRGDIKKAGDRGAHYARSLKTGLRLDRVIEAEISFLWEQHPEKERGDIIPVAIDNLVGMKIIQPGLREKLIRKLLYG